MDLRHVVRDGPPTQSFALWRAAVKANEYSAVKAKERSIEVLRAMIERHQRAVAAIVDPLPTKNGFLIESLKVAPEEVPGLLLAVRICEVVCENARADEDYDKAWSAALCAINILIPLGHKDPLF